MLEIKNKLESILRPQLPIHPDWLLVQWGYIALIFTTLLLTTIPVAAGGAMTFGTASTSFQKEKAAACLKGRASSRESETTQECRIRPEDSLTNWPLLNEVPVTPLRLRNDRGSETVRLPTQFPTS